MATNIPPHNLTEVINATVHLIDNPHAQPIDLMEFVKGPDFPTGAMIMGAAPIRQLYETGHGVIKVRAKAEIETKDNGRERIIVTEIPYAVNKESLITKIADLVHAKTIPGISGVNDESSSRVGIRVVIDVKSNEMASVVLNQLYKHSQLQTSFGAQFLVVDRNRPRTMNLCQLLQAYIEHRFEVITRRCKHELQKAEERAHILEGLLIAVDNIDEVVAIIRNSRTREEANTGLITRFELSKLQAKAILEMRLHQLVGLAMDDLRAEYDEVMGRIAYLKDLLAHREKLMGVVKDELIEVRDKFGDERRTEIFGTTDDLDYEDLIKREIVAITVTNTGYIKRTSLEEFRTQKRGGQGVTGMQTKEEDYVRQLFTASTHDYIFFFTDAGKMHFLKVWQIPEAGRAAKGKAIVNLIDIEKDENVRAMVTVAEVDRDDQFLVFATSRGLVKKTCLSAFKHLRKVAIRSINLEEDDDLIDVKLCEEDQEIMIFSRKGRVCRFKESDARAMGRATRGVTGIRLDGEDDAVVAFEVVDPGIDIMTISEQGMGKRSNIGTGNSEIDQGAGYRLTKRGGKGITAMKLRDEDVIVAALRIEDGNELLVTTSKGILIRMSVDDFRAIGRSTFGVKAVQLKKRGDAVSSVSCIQVLDEEEDDGGDDPEGGDGEATEAAESAGEASAEVTEASEDAAESADAEEADEDSAEE